MNLLNLFSALNDLFEDKELKLLKLLINPVFNKYIDWSKFDAEFQIFIKKINKLKYEDRLIELKKIYFKLHDRFSQKICTIYTNSNFDKNTIESKILNKYLINEKVIFDYKIDKNIIGGIRFVYNFQTYDATLNVLLKKIKNEVKNDITI